MRMPTDALNIQVNAGKWESATFDPQTLDALGFFVLRDVVQTKSLNYLRKIYRDESKVSEIKGHPTKVSINDEDTLPFIGQQEIKELLKHFFQAKVGFGSGQFFRKDATHRGKVKLHNDLMYMSGWMEQYSFFVPLTLCSPETGGLILYPGTHKFGLLGDAGELNRDAIPEHLSVCQPKLNPGDLLIMNAATWHESPEFLGSGERIYFEFKVKHKDDPSCNFLHIEESEYMSEYSLPSDSQSLFVDSRLQRLKNLYKNN